MSNPQYALTEIPPHQLSQIPQQGTVTINGIRYQVRLVIPQPQPITQHPDPRPAQYQTLKDQGIPPQSINLPKLPTSLKLTLSAVIALCFLVAASMFSIGLTAYSNSVERTNQTRSFIRVE